MKRDLHTELGISTNDKKTALDINAETVEKNVFANIGTRPHRARKRLGAAVLAAAITVTFCAAAADKMWGGGIWGIFGAKNLCTGLVECAFFFCGKNLRTQLGATPCG